MAQRISSIDTAQGMLDAASQGQGLPGMRNTTAPPIPNAWDGGGSSKPGVNSQPFNNQRLVEQNASENLRSARGPAYSKGLMEARVNTDRASQAEYQAQTNLQARTAEMIYANPNWMGDENYGIRGVSKMMSGPYAEQFEGDLADSRLLAQGLSTADYV